MTVKSGKLGTFSGVFTPSVLTILGIILFMRLGYVVGNAGFGRSLIIIGLANVVSVLTSVSLSAIATNIKVKGGGDYYLISRTLGVEFGGAIGIVLFLAQSVSVTFYCVGFGEAVALMLPSGLITPRIVSLAAIVLLFVFAWLGTDWATKFQYGVMALLAAALISFYAGGIAQWQGDVFISNWNGPGQASDFWILFAIFFPAVTGFTQGVSMSGDLEDPGKSLPRGTFLAVGISIVVYFSVSFIYAGALTNEVLATDYNAMKKVAWYGSLIDAGAIAATLSSAMASFLGAPRILQSMAGDRVFGFLSIFAQGDGLSQNPRRGVLLTAGIALATLALGQLNTIAKVVSMFFLISYGLLNYATYYEARAASPSFRPRFKWFDLRLSLLGFLSCLGIILAVDVKNGLIAIAILFAIYQYLQRTAKRSRWADGGRSYHLQQVRNHLLAAGEDTEHPRDWRPQLLAFTHDLERRPRLLQFAQWLEGNSGITTAVQIIIGQGAKVRKQKQEALKALSDDIIKNNLQAFPLVIATQYLNTALQILIQAYGVGPLHANTIIVNWLDQIGRRPSGIDVVHYTNDLRMLFRLGGNILIVHTDDQKWESITAAALEKPRIDVWWQDNATGRLMLIFAYLLTRNQHWEEAEIRLLASAPEEASKENKASLQQMLDDFRIGAVPEIVLDMSFETVVETSKDAAVMFYPFQIHDNVLTDVNGLSLERILKNVPLIALVMAAEDIDLAAEPEEGAAGDLAQAVDAVLAARKKEKAFKKKSAEAHKNLETLLEKRSKLLQQGETVEEKDSLHKLEKEILRAEEAGEKAVKKEAKISAQIEIALAEAMKLGYENPASSEADSSEEPSSLAQSKEEK